MESAYNLEEIRKKLNQKFKKDSTCQIKMIGIIFIHEKSTLAYTEYIPKLPYFHYRSGKHIDIFSAGYGKHWKTVTPKMEDHYNVTYSGKESWQFSPELFDEFRKYIENLTTWKFSGGTDLLLLNAEYDKENANTFFNLENVFCCNVDKILERKFIPSLSIFFEELFRYSETPSESNPVASFINQMDLKVLKNIFFEIIQNVMESKLPINVLDLNPYVKYVGARKVT